MKTPLLLAASLLGLAYPMPACAADAPRDPSAVPDGLSATAWSTIRAAYEAGRHAFVPQADGTHLARNHAQQWHMSFDGRGFTATPDGGGWEWGLELVPTTMSSSETPGTPTVGTARLLPGNRLSFERDAILEEWFVNDGRGLEQGWTFKARPPGAGDDGSLRLVLVVHHIKIDG